LGKAYFKHFITAFLLFFISFFSHSQTQNTQRNYYKWFDSQIGIENTGLNNGIRYKELYRIKNGKHKFYLSPNFIKGDIFYQGQLYYDIDMKYDLFEDQIIINLETQQGFSTFQLIKDLIDYFIIENKQFIQLTNNKVSNSPNLISGFYEIYFSSSNFILYKKYFKNRIKFLESKVVFSEFRNKYEYYIFYNNTYYLIDRKNDFRKIFPSQMKIITSFYNKNKILLKSNYDLFMMQLSNKINNSINELSNIN
jgi:hypothetical protein